MKERAKNLIGEDHNVVLLGKSYDLLQCISRKDCTSRIVWIASDGQFPLL